MGRRPELKSVEFSEVRMTNGGMLRIRCNDIEKSWRRPTSRSRQPFLYKRKTQRIWNGWQPPSSNPLSFSFVQQGLPRYLIFTPISRPEKCCTYWEHDPSFPPPERVSCHLFMCARAQKPERFFLCCCFSHAYRIPYTYIINAFLTQVH